jgi:tetratricopeptide (TPR) repeat protein
MTKKFTPTIIVILFLQLFLTGCANDQYTLEREFWRSQKLARKILMNPHSSPPKEVENSVNLLSAFANKYPNNPLGVKAEFSIAQLYNAKEEYEKARMQLQAVMNRHKESKEVSAQALFLNGKTFEKENKWDLALQQYERIIQEYPLTISGFEIPMYISRYYKTKHQPDKMLSWYEKAIAHYKAIAQAHPNTFMGFSADTLVARCYVELKDWPNVITTYDHILSTYIGKANLDFIQLEKALIYKRELKDEAKAKELLERFVKDNPESKLLKIAQGLLQSAQKK